MSLRVHSLGEPSNPPIIMLHGFWMNHSDFLPLAQKLSDHYYCIMPNFPGRADAPYIEPKYYTYDHYHQLLCQWMDSQHIKNPVFIGTSMGGIIALRYAAHFPENVSGLIINDIGVKVSIASQEKIALSMLAAKNTYSYDPNLLLAFYNKRGTFRRFQEIDYSSYWDAVTCPTLLLKAQESDMISDEDYADLTAQAHITGSRMAGTHPLDLTANDTINAMTLFLTTA